MKLIKEDKYSVIIKMILFTTKDKVDYIANFNDFIDEDGIYRLGLNTYIYY